MKLAVQVVRDKWFLILRYAVSLLLWAALLCSALFVSNTTPLLLLALIGLGCFFLPDRVRFTPMTALVLVFFAYLIACDVFLFPGSSGFGMYRKMLCAFFAGVAIFYAQKDSNAFFTLPLPLIASILLGVALLFFKDSSIVDGRFALFMKHPNSMAFMFAIAAVTGFSFLASPAVGTERKWIADPLLPSEMRDKRFLSLLVLCCLAGIWLTASRTSFYGTILVCFLLVLGAAGKKLGIKKALLVFISMSLLTGMAAYAASPLLLRSATVQRMFVVAKAPWEDTTFRSRIPGWESAFTAFQKQPLFGNGPESFAKTHAEYVRVNRERLVQKLGRDIVEHDTSSLPHAHNQYLMVLAESGVIGLVLFLSLFAYPLYVSVRRRSLFGATVPLLFLFLLLGILEAPFSGSRAASASVTVFYMLLGYFSGAAAPVRQQ